ncbi:MAG: 50S ribosomal protein L9 [Desulfobulbaceae bacterium]|nr:50S ribosomal protein L9 [Desulfobulbaceae bacterium]
MEIILKETIDTLGREGDIVKVKAGYARNFLIPQKKAVLITKASLARLKQEQDAINSRLATNKEKAEALNSQIEKLTLKIAKKAGEENRLFGSVTNGDIADALEQAGVTVDKRSISISEPIKTLGEYKVSIKVGYQMTTSIALQVIEEVAGD